MSGIMPALGRLVLRFCRAADEMSQQFKHPKENSDIEEIAEYRVAEKRNPCCITFEQASPGPWIRFGANDPGSEICDNEEE